MKVASHIVLGLTASSIADLEDFCAPIRRLEGGTPAQDPPVVNPIGAPYQDPNQPTWLRVEDLLSRMPLREKQAQLMQGELERWVNFDTGEFNVTGMKDHMFYHPSMLRGKSAPIESAIL